MLQINSLVIKIRITLNYIIFTVIQIYKSQFFKKKITALNGNVFKQSLWRNAPMTSCIPDRFMFRRHWGFRKIWSRKFPLVGEQSQILAECLISFYRIYCFQLKVVSFIATDVKQL